MALPSTIRCLVTELATATIVLPGVPVFGHGRWLARILGMRTAVRAVSLNILIKDVYMHTAAHLDGAAYSNSEPFAFAADQQLVGLFDTAEAMIEPIDKPEVAEHLPPIEFRIAGHSGLADR